MLLVFTWNLKKEGREDSLFHNRGGLIDSSILNWKGISMNLLLSILGAPLKERDCFTFQKHSFRGEKKK